MKWISTISICAAALLSLAAGAQAQSPNATADMCANYARQSWPNDYIYNSYQRARQQVYTNCMMEHGLRP